MAKDSVEEVELTELSDLKRSDGSGRKMVVLDVSMEAANDAVPLMLAKVFVGLLVAEGRADVIIVLVVVAWRSSVVAESGSVLAVSGWLFVLVLV